MKDWLIDKRISIYVVLLVFLILFAWYCLFSVNIPSSLNYMSIDVNPGIEFGFNDNGDIISIHSVNSAGEEILAVLNLSETTKEQAISLVIEELIETGYISPDGNNPILISTLGDSEQTEQVTNEFSNLIVTQLEENNINSIVIVQRIENDNEILAEAQKHGITFGKMKLIQDILCCNNNFNVEELVDYTIKDLENIALENGVALHIEEVATHPITAEYEEGYKTWDELSSECQNELKEIYSDEDLDLLFQPRRYVAMPNVVGMTEGEAVATMKNVGLVPQSDLW